MQHHIPLLAWIFTGLIVAAAIVWLWRHRKERAMDVDRLWRFPAAMTALILPLVYLQPHRPFHMFDYVVFGAMMTLGTTTGFIRARAARLRIDESTGRLMVGISLWMVLMLLPVGAMRQYAREHLDMGFDALRRGDVRAVIGSLLFALAMIVTHRMTLYLRARRLIATPAPPQEEENGGRISCCR